MSIFGLPYNATSRSNGSFTITGVPSTVTTNLTVRARISVGITNYVGSATGYRSAGAACRGWMASAPHRANILNPHFRLIGVGFARSAGASYFVEDFGAYRH